MSAISDLKTNWRNGILIVVFLWSYRLGHMIRSRMINWPILRRIVLFVPYLFHGALSHSFGCFLPFAASLGQRIEFRHGLYGVFISTGAKIGDDCTIYHNVTVGSTGKGAPTIESGVLLGACCVIVGPIFIGQNAKIGANETVRENVPVNSVYLSPKNMDQVGKTF